ncbi:hypothetical protein CCY99_06100 [Helicobacter sp. 16-1353]|uniref:hypothetical protein n=1 Tax=Helicobacter sp. 16-1353 TaxID=2004996 RepID=UPI000DCC5F2F|nr:hypothetical protein [Helicobacter sp. 16-1353]RAX53162.1 hypothetical protein CCY99_06100 [Helicobacter sp. 16-1353]
MKKIYLALAIILSHTGLYGEELLKNVIDNTTIDGFLFGRIFSNFGKDGSGTSTQYRLKFDVRTGDLAGFRVGSGIFFGIGTSVPDGTKADGDIQGWRAAVPRRAGDRFGLSNLFADYHIKPISSYIEAGRLNIKHVNTDPVLDMGNGASMYGKMDTIKYRVSFYDSWLTDLFYYLIVGRGAYTNQSNTNNFGIGNNLVIADFNQTINDFNYILSATYASKFMDYNLWADLMYDLPKGFFLRGQVGIARLNKNAKLQIGGANLPAANIYNESFKLGNHAKDRGIYNLQAGYKNEFMTLKIGFLGSFLQGYGVMMEEIGSLDIGGAVWYGGITSAYEGFSFLGSGGIKNSSVYSPYIKTSYTINDIVGLGLDLAYIGGNNYMPILSKAKRDNTYTINEIYGITNAIDADNYRFIKNLKFFELTPSITLQVNKYITINAYLANFFGGLSYSKVKFQITARI